jgi:hypothetical protein
MNTLLILSLLALNFTPSGGSKRWVQCPTGKTDMIILYCCCKGDNYRGYDGISANISAKENYTYRVRYKVTRESGFMWIILGGYNSGVIRNESGTYDERVKMTDARSNGNGELYFMGSNNFVGKIELLLIQEYYGYVPLHINNIFIQPNVNQ